MTYFLFSDGYQRVSELGRFGKFKDFSARQFDVLAALDTVGFLSGLSGIVGFGVVSVIYSKMHKSFFISNVTKKAHWAGVLSVLQYKT